MFNILIILKLFVLIAVVSAKYNGPFIFWGQKDLDNLYSTSLNDLDENILHRIYLESPAIILFVRNTSNRINEEDFPIFKDILQQTKHLYSTQHRLPLDPVDFNLNTDIINLVGPTSQQDVELSALYRDAVLANGDGNVLGILATKVNEQRMKRETSENSDSSSSTTVTAPVTSESSSNESDQQTKFLYYPETGAAYKILLQTDKAPRLFNGSFRNVLDSSNKLVTTDQRHPNAKFLKIQEKTPEALSISFIFNIASGSWNLIGVEISSNINTDSTYLISVDKPSAPLGFSYKCSKPLIFRNGSIFLEFANIQVQPNVSSRRFSEAYDCVGFTSAPIWSGIFVSAIIGLVVAIGINCILEIKAPNRFENSRGKQLTFTIQE